MEAGGGAHGRRADRRAGAWGDGHYNHEGWYVVWRYLMDPTRALGRSVVVWRVDCAYLRASDWKYVGSRANDRGGGRTHTFTVVQPRAVFSEPAFALDRVQVVRGKPVITGG